MKKLLSLFVATFFTCSYSMLSENIGLQEKLEKHLNEYPVIPIQLSTKSSFSLSSWLFPTTYPTYTYTNIYYDNATQSRLYFQQESNRILSPDDKNLCSHLIFERNNKLGHFDRLHPSFNLDHPINLTINNDDKTIFQIDQTTEEQTNRTLLAYNLIKTIFGYPSTSAHSIGLSYGQTGAFNSIDTFILFQGFSIVKNNDIIYKNDDDMEKTYKNIVANHTGDIITLYNTKNIMTIQLKNKNEKPYIQYRNNPTLTKSVTMKLDSSGEQLAAILYNQSSKSYHLHIYHPLNPSEEWDKLRKLNLPIKENDLSDQSSIQLNFSQNDDMVIISTQNKHIFYHISADLWWENKIKGYTSVWSEGYITNNVFYPFFSQEFKEFLMQFSNSKESCLDTSMNKQSLLDVAKKPILFMLAGILLMSLYYLRKNTLLF